jgi:mannan endo-1,4-beta-mannosidase
MKQSIIKTSFAFAIFTAISINCHAFLPPGHLQTQGKNLIYKTNFPIGSPNPAPIVLRGVNYAAYWVYDANNPQASLSRIDEIAKTGANSVRLVWDGAAEYGRDTKVLDAFLARCQQNNMIPVPELHHVAGTYFTCNDLTPQIVDLAVQYWTSPAVLAVLKKYNNIMILNICNELGRWDGQPFPAQSQQCLDAYRPAIQKLRNAGYTCPIMIDAPSCGQNGESLAGANYLLLREDPIKNLIFSVHPYWQNNTDYMKRLGQIMALNTGSDVEKQCWVVGEFSCAQSCDAAAAKNDYQAVMKFCNANGVGYYAWDWGGSLPFTDAGAACPADNGRGANYVRTSMTDKTGNFTTLKGWGLDVANDIKATSKKRTLR